MAAYRRIGERWRAEVFRCGVRESAYFDSHAAAQAWATTREAEIIAGRRNAVVTLRSLLDRYVREVSPTHKGARWERVRAEAICRDVEWADMAVSKITPQHVIDYRDARLKDVSSGTVLRDMGFLSGVFRHAISEWHNVQTNPFAGIKRPGKPAHRDRVISDEERDRLVAACSPRTAAVFLFALETGMRAGEICGLTWDRVHEKHVTLEETKNGTRRDVPLTKRARELLAIERTVSEGPTVFGMQTASLDTMFRRARDKAGLPDVHFHDARHTAATRHARVLSLLELCRVFGWRDTKHALVYYNESAASIADRL